MKKLNLYKDILFYFALLVFGAVDHSALFATDVGKAKAITTQEDFTIDSVSFENENNQKDPDTYWNYKIDSSYVEVRLIDSVKIKKYLKDKDFRYFEDPAANMNLWERFMDWLSRQFIKMTDTKTFGTAWDLFTYLLIIFAIVAILWGIFRSEVKGLFFSDKTFEKIKSSESIEDIHSIKFDELIEKAIENKNFRYAVRLNYLKSLKLLSDMELIKWRIDKTNREYLIEISKENLRSDFYGLTSTFESIWYGGLEVKESKFDELQLFFNNFNSQLKSSR